jgi:hypothetical protein
MPAAQATSTQDQPPPPPREDRSPPEAGKLLSRRRFRQSGDLDAMLVALGSDKSHFIIGAVIHIDDGFAL